MDIKKTLLSLLIVAGLVACSDKDNNNETPITEENSTWVSLSIELPSARKTRVADGTYVGRDTIATLDVYMQSTDGVVERAERFTGTDIAINGSVVSTTQPFRTSSGYKNIYVVINDVDALGSTAIKETDAISTNGLARVETINGVEYDLIMMTGVAKAVFIEPDIPAQDVITDGTNKIKVDATRLASRVIVTLNEGANAELENTAGQKIGTIARNSITYSVAQGANKVYWLQDYDSPTYATWGYNYVPAFGEYAGQATQYYDYADLHSPALVPNKPAAADGYKSMTGKFLFENIHKFGDETTTGYRKGNTAYVLIRATFTPYPAAIADGGTLTNGTFYVGQSDGKIYSSKKAAQDAVHNQKVATYVGGKMVQFAWLNPDNVLKPYNSPVVKNSIYHINITGFKRLGFNWNPLYPENPDTTDPQNPDAKPGPEEPEIPIAPEDLLSIEETYMSVEVTVLDWYVYTYDIEF